VRPVIQRVHSEESSRSQINKLFDDARKRLVETGTRNRLVHVNRANTKGNVLNVADAHSDGVYGILADRRTMRFVPMARGKDASGDPIVLAGHDGATEHGADAGLLTRLGPDALQKKLLKMAREAKTAEEESGVNILYLALGFLTWFEDKASSVPREAPLVLLPVELVRNARTSTYDLRLRDDDVMTNLPLQQRLREDFGLDLPVLEIEEGWSPAAYFAAVEAVITVREGWRIDAHAIQLGFFSFSASC
jgi:hypothetical protein